MIRVVHVTTGLLAGGAERVLVDVATRVDRSRFEPTVISLTTRGPLAADLEAAGVPVHAMEFNRSVPDPVAFTRLARLLRRVEPHLVETWLTKADLIGGLASRIAVRAPLLWSVHVSDIPYQAGVRSNALGQRIGARMSRWLPKLIVCVSEEAANAHAALGYDRGKFRIVPNGFDTERFQPDPDARAAVRTDLGIGQDTLVVGLVARFDPQKDHTTFARAARTVLDEIEGVQFVLCGREITTGNASLVGVLDRAGILDRTQLLGVREDMPAITASFDIAASSSAFGEAFSLALGEAMACGVPCVTTDVGNAAAIVGDTGRVVPAKQPAALADGILELLRTPAEQRRALGTRARDRIVADFSLPVIVRRYEEIYAELVGAAAR